MAESIKACYCRAGRKSCVYHAGLGVNIHTGFSSAIGLRAASGAILDGMHGAEALPPRLLGQGLGVALILAMH